ncbi:MAG: 2OG-Fe(II) oxygenase family protein, partial [Actinomycetota bacterium]
GFLTVVGHGVDDDVVARAWDTARSFFDLPLADKMQVAMPRPGYPYGYSPLAGETLAASLGERSLPDLKESFAIGPVDPRRHELIDPDEEFAWSTNLWPAAIAEFRPAWEAYYRALSALAAQLLGSMALALDLPEDHFEPMIDRHTSAMRALNYPPASSAENGRLGGRLGASAHTDYGTLTILLTDPSQGGLQVEGLDGEWNDVRPVPGSFVVNLGDAMSRWTNDRWRSTMHRVVVPAGRRQSIAFFHNANWDAVIECIPSCLEPGASPRHNPIAAGPHLMQKFRSTVNTY